MDDLLDRCRHGRVAADFCPSCDRSEVTATNGLDERRAGEDGADKVDLRDRPTIDIRDAPERRAGGTIVNGRMTPPMPVCHPPRVTTKVARRSKLLP